MPVVVDIHEKALAMFLLPGGEVNDEIKRYLRYARDVSKAFAPKRSGALAENIRATFPKMDRKDHTYGYIYANIKHAEWVVGGTNGSSRAAGRGMRVPKSRTSPVRGAALPNSAVIMRRHVAGQQANNFFKRANAATMTAYKSGVV